MVNGLGHWSGCHERKTSVRHFVGGLRSHLFDANKTVYAVVALALMVGRGVARGRPGPEPQATGWTTLLQPPNRPAGVLNLQSPICNSQFAIGPQGPKCVWKQDTLRGVFA